MKKTIREWLVELPEPYRTQAMEVADNEVLDNRRRSMSSALCGAFLWSSSPQGRAYWGKLYDELCEKEKNQEEVEERKTNGRCAKKFKNVTIQ